MHAVLLLALHAPLPFLAPASDGRLADPSRLAAGQVVWVACGLDLRVEAWTVAPACDQWKAGCRWQLEREGPPGWNGGTSKWRTAVHPASVLWTARAAAERHLARMEAAGAKPWLRED